MSEERYLTFALGKGRLAKMTLELFEQIGITCDEMKDKDTRKLIFVNEEYKLRFSWLKAPMFPLMSNTVLRISVWSVKIRFWKKLEMIMKSWILVLENAVCVSAVPLPQENFKSIMRGSG